MPIDLETMMAELIKSQAKTDAQLAKTDAQLAKTDKQLAKTDAQLAKTDKQLAKTDAQLAKTDKKLDRIANMVGGIANNQGDIAEEFFYNSLASYPSLAGIEYDFIIKNATRKKKAVEDEYDLLLVNSGDVAIIETKYKAHKQDLQRLLTKKYPNFKALYPEYNNYRHHLNLASFHIADELKELALENGVSVLQRKGDIVETTVSKKSRAQRKYSG